MLFKALADLADRENLVTEPYYEQSAIQFEIRIGKDGKYLGLVPIGTTTPKGKLKPLKMVVPKIEGSRSSNAAYRPFFLSDYPTYITGLDDKKWGKEKKKNFALQVETAVEKTNDVALRAVLSFLMNEESVSACAKDFEKFEETGRVCFFYTPTEEYVHDRKVVRDYWNNLHLLDREGDKLPCLVCGIETTPVKLHNKIGFIGGDKPTPMVSVNGDAFRSWGLEGSSNAPFCSACSSKCTAALNRLSAFEPKKPIVAEGEDDNLPRQNIQIRNNLSALYWTRSGSNDISSLISSTINLVPDEDKVQEVFDTIMLIKHGELAHIAADEFFLLVVSAEPGRPAFRNFFHSSLETVYQNIADFFYSSAIITREAPEERHFGLFPMLYSLIPESKKNNFKDQELLSSLYLSVIRGTPFPNHVLDMALRRMRKGGNRHNPARMALIRACLIRSNTIPDYIQENLHMALNREWTNIGYCLGRLLSTIERMQYSYGGSRNNNIADKFYSAASQRPSSVFPTILLPRMRMYLKKARWAEATIQEIMSMLPANDDQVAWPSRLSQVDQGTFAQGYYHQKVEFDRQADQRKNQKVEAEAELI